MPDLTPDIVADVLAACQAGAGEAAEAFGRALDGKFALAVGQAGTLDPKALPAGLDGPGLAIVLSVGPAAAVVLLPEATGLLPAWYAQPDATGKSKLTTLAQELGMTLLPEQFMPEGFEAARVANLGAALTRGGAAAGAAVVPLELSSAAQGVAWLIWPIAHPFSVLKVASQSEAASHAAHPPAAKPVAAAKPAPAPKPAPAAKPVPKEPELTKRQVAKLRELPEYTQSLLRIEVPVIVTLAENRLPLHRIIDLGPGSMIQFDKSCEDMLALSVGDRRVAEGEAVKVGDKFGLRITSIVLPEERFRPVKPLGK
jgi:flagellar motor switch/type III secretory pathway protein FliN